MTYQPNAYLRSLMLAYQKARETYPHFAAALAAEIRKEWAKR
jgi:hypothetical protein